ncbi:pirin family protein [uncultured Hymenobacter sp.]|uniref:pirin family protein n=1 Tax=uncultured Hymenobacter sp. TaxID=170016 RepID=UPI0035CBEE57
MKSSLLPLILCLAISIGCQTNAETPLAATAGAAPLPAAAPEYVVHKANSRGTTQTGWLLSRHTFSFNNYYDQNRVGFGALRVLNDDWVKAGAGFPDHDHAEMEIVSIPLHGGVAHTDSKGSSGITSLDAAKGTYTVQHMSAGEGISHSEYNASQTDSARFLQIWVAPNRKDIAPAYHQKAFQLAGQQNRWQTLLSPTDAGALKINQDAVFSMAELSKGQTLPYQLKYKGGVYAFVLEGAVTVNGVALERRDGLGLWNTPALSVVAQKPAQVLLIEVPLQ